MKRITTLTLWLTASIMIACTANNEIDIISTTNGNQGEVVNYTVDEALKTLYGFLATADDNSTRSGRPYNCDKNSTPVIWSF